MSTDNYAVIMAGGVGSRFWPMSKTSFPKQFHDLLGTGQTLIQTTYSRLCKIVPQDHIFILTNALYKDLVQRKLPEITDQQILLEPAMRNTAPCILLSALKIQNLNPNANIIVAPSDHWIEDEDAFAKNVNQAFAACQKEELLMTLGIQPTFPHTGYGYIQYDATDTGRIKSVKKFTEKPDYPTAKGFLDAGNYLWNAGIFIWSAQAIISAFKQHLPEMYQLFTQDKATYNTEADFIAQTYPQANSISIDYGIMEKAENVVVLPAEFDWNDLGSWGSLYDKLPKNKEDNVIINAQCVLDDTRGNIIRASKDKIVVVKGLNNHIIVETDQVLLIYPKDDEQEIKAVRATVQEKFGTELG